MIEPLRLTECQAASQPQGHRCAWRDSQGSDLTFKWVIMTSHSGAVAVYNRDIGVGRVWDSVLPWTGFGTGRKDPPFRRSFFMGVGGSVGQRS